MDIKGFDEKWQADLVDMPSYAQVNKGYNKILTVIDIFSKFAWTVPVQKETAQDVTAAMASVSNKDECQKNFILTWEKNFTIHISKNP